MRIQAFLCFFGTISSLSATTISSSWPQSLCPQLQKPSSALVDCFLTFSSAAAAFCNPLEEMVGRKNIVDFTENKT